MLTNRRLIDTGRGVVDASEIVAVLDVDDAARAVVKQRFFADIPPEFRCEIITRQASFWSDLPTVVIVWRWREALELREPIGGADDR